MIEIYLPTNTNYTANGDIALDPISCVDDITLNGSWTRTLTHMIDEAEKWKYIVEGAVIKAPSFNGNQLYRITDVQKSDGGVTANADPIFLDCVGDCFLVDVRPTKKTGAQALKDILSPNSKYSSSSDIATTNTAYYILKNAMEAIAGEDDTSFLNRWGGEIIYDNYKIEINKQAGADRGLSLLYGKNIPVNGMSEKVDMSEVVTRIVPKSYNGYTLAGTSPWVNSPIINSYPTVHTKVIEYPNIMLEADVEGQDTEGKTVCKTLAALRTALRTAANQEFTNGIDKPKVSINCDMVLLGNTEEYKEFTDLEKVSLGDTIHCKHTKLGIVTDARVVALKYDCVNKAVTDVTIGSVETNFLDRVSSSVNATEKALTKSGDVIASQIEGFIDAARAQLRLQNSIAEKQDVRAILFEDLDPDSSTFGAMALGTQGFQISRQRTADDSDWVWTTFGTAAGFNADLITAGTIKALNISGSKITGGTISGTTLSGSTITGGTVTGATLKSPWSSTNLGGTEISGGVQSFSNSEGTLNGKVFGAKSSSTAIGTGIAMVAQPSNFVEMGILDSATGTGYKSVIGYRGLPNYAYLGTLGSDKGSKFHLTAEGSTGNTALCCVVDNNARVFLQGSASSKRVNIGAPKSDGTAQVQIQIDSDYATLYTPLRTNGKLQAYYNSSWVNGWSGSVPISSSVTLRFVNGLLVATS